MSYKGKRVIVSGCYSGMGEAVARQLQALGAEVHGLDFRDSSLPLASFNRIDLRDDASIVPAVAAIGGVVDGLFNCAGLPNNFGALETVKVNFLGTRALTEAVVPLLCDGSAVVSVSSIAGVGWSRRLASVMELVATVGYDAGLDWCDRNMAIVGEGYSLSKEALIVWTLVTAARLIKRGIRVNCTLPGPTTTPMMPHFEAASPAGMLDAIAEPIGRRATSDEQAAALLFLNSDVASYVNGIAMPVDGGFTGAMATGQIDMSAVFARARPAAAAEGD